MKRIPALPLYIGSIYGVFGHAAIDTLESGGKSDNHAFDLWPDIDLAHDLFKKILSTD